MLSKRYYIYTDESNQTGNRYMVLSGVILPEANLDKVESSIAVYRNTYNMQAELKWERVANQRYEEYKAFVDYFFSLNNADAMHFKALVVDNHKIDNRKYNAGDRELGFFKFYYQLLLHSFGRNFGSYDLHVFLDNKSTSQPLDEFRDILNNGIAKRYGISGRPFKLVEFKDSKQHGILQLNDVVLGGIAHRKNGTHLISTTREAKKNLSKYIVDQAGLTDEISTTRQPRFSIWNFLMNGK